MKVMIHFGVLLALFMFLSSAAVGQTIYSVNSAGDDANANPGDGICFTGNFVSVPGFGDVNECTLRAAIQEANATSGAVEIRFSSHIELNFFGSTLIAPETNLPAITNTVSIQGDSHPAFDVNNGRPQVRIISPTGTSLMYGLSFLGPDSSGSSVHHLSIGPIEQDGIQIDQTSDIVLNSNDFGVFRMNNGTIVNQIIPGVAIRIANSTAVTVFANNITNSGAGVQIGGNSAGIAVTGNNIGALLDGESWSVRGNNGPGVRILDTTVGSNDIGNCGLVFCIGNRIVGNETGIVIEAGAVGQSIVANQIGVDPAGSTDSDWGNEGIGVFATNNGNAIGDGSAIGANVIGHNTSHGILLGESETVLSNDNSIDYNYIGILPDGGNVGNGESGVIAWGTNNALLDNRIFNHGEDYFGASLRNGSVTVRGNRIEHAGVCLHVFQVGAGSVIGGLQGGKANVFGNCIIGARVSVAPDGMDIQGNYIGTDADGNALEVLVGLYIDGLATRDVHVGSVTDPELGANVLGHAELPAVQIVEARRVVVVGNYIGLHPNGTPIPNGLGVRIASFNNNHHVNDHRIGYGVTHSIPAKPFPPLGNVIAHNVGPGVRMSIHSEVTNAEVRNNSVRGNRMFANGDSGILLGTDGEGGVIDPGGNQDGPNDLMNFPEFQNIDTWYNDETGLIEYSYQVRTNPENAVYPLIIDFYLAYGQTDQGEIYLGSDQYPSSSANSFRTGTLTPPAGVNPAGAYLVATATDQGSSDGITIGNTSQFTAVPVALGELTDELFSDRFEE